MKIKKYLIIGTVLVIISLIVLVYFTSLESKPYSYNNITLEDLQNSDVTLINNTQSLFYSYVPNNQIITNPDGTQSAPFFYLFPKQELESTYDTIRNDQKSVVVNPIFTASAYNNGFYVYFAGNCDASCLTVPVIDGLSSGFTSSFSALQVLDFLQYDVISDFDVHMNPNILNDYDKVIILHNEYVTKEIFDALENHPKVIYLYPNALYGEVEYNSFNILTGDDTKPTVTLIRGHNYPTPDVVNGFDWKNENTHPFEYDVKCNDWEFYEIDNGYMLNCYPENVIMSNFEMLKVIKDL